MKLSYIIPVYNVKQYLDECLSSLYKQGLGGQDFEVILIDDGSTDASLEIARRWEREKTNIKVLCQENQGQGVARNRGLDVACGDYVSFVDSDDYLMEGCMAPLLAKMQELQLDVLRFGLVVQTSDGKTHKQCDSCQTKATVYTGEECLERDASLGSVWGALYKREMITGHHLQFVRGMTHEDVAFANHIMGYAKRVMYVNAPVYFYRYNINSTDRSRDAQKVKRGLRSDFHVAAYLKRLSRNREFSVRLRALYGRKANSIVASRLVGLKRCEVYSRAFARECLELACQLGCYPLRGRTMSWKSTILVPLLNIKALLGFYYR